MSGLSGPQKGALAHQIIDATKEGRVTDWVERIAEIARMADLPLCNINWVAAPSSVAFEVVTVAGARGGEGKLEAALAKYKEAAK